MDAECCSLFDLVCHIMSTNEEVFLHDMWGDPGWAEHIAQPLASRNGDVQSSARARLFARDEGLMHLALSLGNVREAHTSRLLEVQMPFFRPSKWVRHTQRGLLRPLPREK